MDLGFVFAEAGLPNESRRASNKAAVFIAPFHEFQIKRGLGLLFVLFVFGFLQSMSLLWEVDAAGALAVPDKIGMSLRPLVFGEFQCQQFFQPVQPGFEFSVFGL